MNTDTYILTERDFRERMQWMLNNHYQYPADALKHCSIDFWREVKDLFDLDSIFKYYYTEYLRNALMKKEERYLLFNEYMQKQYPELKELWNKIK